MDPTLRKELLKLNEQGYEVNIWNERIIYMKEKKLFGLILIADTIYDSNPHFFSFYCKRKNKTKAKKIIEKVLQLLKTSSEYRLQSLSSDSLFSYELLEVKDFPVPHSMIKDKMYILFYFSLFISILGMLLSPLSEITWLGKTLSFLSGALLGISMGMFTSFKRRINKENDIFKNL